MKSLKSIYPQTGIIQKSKQTIPSFKIVKNSKTESSNKRFEIFNIHGEIVCITRDLRRNNLQLEKGFYLIKEKDQNGMFIKNSKLIL